MSAPCTSMDSRPGPVRTTPVASSAEPAGARRGRLIGRGIAAAQSAKAARARTADPTRTLVRMGTTILPLELNCDRLRVAVGRLLDDELFLGEPRDETV